MCFQKRKMKVVFFKLFFLQLHFKVVFFHIFVVLLIPVRAYSLYLVPRLQSLCVHERRSTFLWESNAHSSKKGTAHYWQHWKSIESQFTTRTNSLLSEALQMLQMNTFTRKTRFVKSSKKSGALHAIDT
jgi:hypothetical protein